MYSEVERRNLARQPCGGQKASNTVMRPTTFVLAALLFSSSLACHGTDVTAARRDSRLVVFVHWQNHGLPDRSLTIVELDMERTTNQDGLAEFRLPPGTYTLRAFVNAGGPPLYVDRTVTLEKGETLRVEVVDCVPCVSP